jgi:hypothetical protein
VTVKLAATDHEESDVTSNPIDWWISKVSTFPTVYRYALDTLSCPAMSTECKGVFSSIRSSLHLAPLTPFLPIRPEKAIACVHEPSTHAQTPELLVRDAVRSKKLQMYPFAFCAVAPSMKACILICEKRIYRGAQFGNRGRPA